MEQNFQSSFPIFPNFLPNPGCDAMLAGFCHDLPENYEIWEKSIEFSEFRKFEK